MSAAVRRKIICVTRRIQLEAMTSSVARAMKMSEPPTFVYRFHEMVDLIQQQDVGTIVIVDGMHSDRGMQWCDFVQRAAWETLANFGSFIIVLTPEITPVHFAVASEYYVSKMVLERQTNPEQLAFNLSNMIEKQDGADLFAKMIFEVQKARKADNNSALDEATLLLFRHFPKLARARIEYADRCLRLSETEAAKEIVVALAQEYPLLVQTLMLRARLAILQGDMKGAEEMLFKAEAASPRNFERLAILAKLCAKKPTAERALEMLRTAIAIRGADKLPHVELCRVISLFGNLDELNESLARLTEDEVVRVLNSSAVELLKDNNFPRAERLFEIAIGNVKDAEMRARLRYNLAVGFVKAGLYDKAESLLMTVLESLPEFDKAKVVLGRIRTRNAAFGGGSEP